MLIKREVKKIPYSGYHVDSYVVLDHNDDYLISVCDFLLETSINGSPQNTTRSYASDLITFFSTLQSTKNIDSLFPSDFREVTASNLDAHLIGNLRQKKGFSEATVIRHAATLNLFYKFAFENDYIEYLIKWKPEKKLSTKATLMDKTMSRIGGNYIELETFEKIILPNIKAKSSFKRARDELALKLGFYAGLRSHELVKYGNFSLKRMKELIPKDSSALLSEHLSIRGKGGKVRRLPMNPNLVAEIYHFMYGHHKNKLKNSLFEDGTGRSLIDEQYGSDIFSSAIDEYISSNTVSSKVFDELKRKGYHSLRHTYATNAVTFCHDVDTKYNPRWAVTQWMGHANPKTTEIYICYEAIKNNRLGVIEAMKLSDIHFPSSLTE
jgi:site-specific recombinase XerD